MTTPPPSPDPSARAFNPHPPSSYTPHHLAERILAAQAALEARGAADEERKTITALFADIKGSMELIEDLDPEDARSLIDPALKLMMDAIHRYEGYVAQSMGDGIFALFGAPVAHEDHAHRALYAALRMQEDSRHYAEKLRLEKGINLQLRVGINTGAVVVRSIRKDDLHTDYIPVGHSTSLAARMESLATPGSIVVSEHTYKLTAGYFQFKELGAAKVKGVSTPVCIYELVGVGPLRTRLQVAAKRGLARFVGRQSELTHLQQVRELAETGHGQLVGVVGEPGVGKSRLFHEFKLLSQQNWLVLETFSAAHGRGYPFLPLIELLKNYFQILPQDDARKVREKVGGKVFALDRSLDGTLPYLFALLGIAEFAVSLHQMDSQIRRQRTFEAIKRLLLRESLDQPLLILFEDLQWLDNETQAFLDVFIDGLATARMLLLVNYRPEYQHAWGGKTYYSQLRLDALGKVDAEELLSALLKEKGGVVAESPLQPLKQLILEKTEGTPFFMEEIIQALFDQGVLARDPGGVFLTQPITEIQIPPTVQGVLAARIDRLSTQEKDLLQTLAVIGKEFSFSLLKHVVNQPEDVLQPLMSRLQAAEFIYEQLAFPESHYTFKHTLTQEVAYNSLLVERRRSVHERTAQTIEALFQDQLTDHYRELAYHYTRSGDVEKAIGYLQRAGEHALQRSAYAEAISDLSEALELLNGLPNTPEHAEQELTVLITLGTPLIATKGYAAPEVESVYTRARELCRQVGEAPQLFPVLFGLWRFYLARGEYKTARELGEQLLRLAHCIRDSAFSLPAHLALGFTFFRLGEFAAAQAHLEHGVVLYNPQQHDPEQAGAIHYGQDPGVACLSWLAWTLWHLGYPDQALQRSQEALALAHELGHPFSLAFALHFAAAVHRRRREGSAAQKKAETVIALSNEHGFPYFMAGGLFMRGWALAEQGQLEAGIAQVQESLAVYRATGVEQLGQLCGLLAELYGKVGRVQAGLQLLAEAQAEMNKSQEHWWEAELYRLKGELLLRSRAVRRASSLEKECEFH